MWLRNDYLLWVPQVGSKQYGYVFSSFFGSTKWEQSPWQSQLALLRVRKMASKQCSYKILSFSVCPKWGETNV